MDHVFGDLTKTDFRVIVYPVDKRHLKKENVGMENVEFQENISS